MDLWEYVSDSKRADLEVRGLTLIPIYRSARVNPLKANVLAFCCRDLDKQIGKDVVGYPVLGIVHKQLDLFK